VDIFRFAAAEFRAIARNRRRLIPVLGVCTIPLLYSFGFLWSFWNPYGHLDRLPVAVVNEDKGTVVNGKKVNVGRDFENRLRNNPIFDWSFVSPEEAESGLKEHRYYMAVTIPPDFSATSMTALDAHPKQAVLQYTLNDGYNYLSAQMGRSGMEKVKEQLGDTLTAEYAQTLLADIRRLSAGLKQASGGANQIAGSAGHLDAGAKSLDSHLLALREGAATLAQGVAEANTGTQQLAEGTHQLASSSAALASGLGQLDASAGALRQGAAKAEAGGSQVSGGVQRADDGVKQVSEGVARVADGAAALSQGLDELSVTHRRLTAGTTQVLGGAQQLDAALHQSTSGSAALAKDASALSEQVDTLVQTLTQNPAVQDAMSLDPALAQQVRQLQQLQTQARQMADQLGQAAKGQTQLVASADDLVSGLQTLATGMQQFDAGLGQAAASSRALSSGAGKAASGAASLQQGLDQLAAGALAWQRGQAQLDTGLALFGDKLHEAVQGGQALAAGAHQVDNGARTLATGLRSAAAGAHQVADGSIALSSGAHQLAEGLSTLYQGAAKIAGQLGPSAEQLAHVHTGAANVKALATPVTLTERTTAGVPNYGSGFAPYFASLSLYIGAVMLTVVWPVRDPAVQPRSGLTWFLGKFAVLAAVGLAQASLVDLALLCGLRLHVARPWAFIGLSIGVSWVFLLLVQLLVAAFNEVGRYLAIVILIAQLCASGGTFPLPLIPAVLQRVSPWLPMTYTVGGFRAVIAGDWAYLAQNLAHLAVFPLVTAVLSVALFTLVRRRTTPVSDAAVSA
jgi:putative membrane protein